MFFYSPILAISLFGLCYCKNEDSRAITFFSILAPIFLHLWITSSWNQWQYGGSLGQRPFVDFYPLYAIALCFVIERLRGSRILFENGKTCSLLNFFVPIFVLFILASCKLMLAYWHGVLPLANATMTDILNVFNWNFDEIRNNVLEFIGGRW